MITKKRFTTLTGLVLAASFALTGCAASAQSATEPTASTPKFPAGDVINDGKGQYQLAGVADDDPINKVDLTAVNAATLNTFSNDDIQQAQKLTGAYIADAIDSPMRLPAYQSGIISDHTIAMNRVESDYEKRLVEKYFIKGYLIDDIAKPRDLSNTTDPMQGTAPYRHPGIELTDIPVANHDPAASSAAFSYDYGTDKQRMLTRTMTVQSVTANTIATESTMGNKSYQAPKVDLGPHLGLKVDVAYSVHALLDGKPVVENQHDIFQVDLVKQDGKLVISDVSIDEYKAS